MASMVLQRSPRTLRNNSLSSLNWAMICRNTHPSEVTHTNSWKPSVAELNGKFSNPEQVKKFTVLPRDLSVDEGELTPTLKIRRKQIRENWSSEIEAMYS